MINSNEKIIYLLVIVMLGLAYLICFDLAKRGHGYIGADRHFRRHSIWYIRHYDHGYYASNRERSAHGNRFSSRGLSGGK